MISPDTCYSVLGYAIDKTRKTANVLAQTLPRNLQALVAIQFLLQFRECKENALGQHLYLRQNQENFVFKATLFMQILFHCRTVPSCDDLSPTLAMLEDELCLEDRELHRNQTLDLLGRRT